MDQEILNAFFFHLIIPERRKKADTSLMEKQEPTKIKMKILPQQRKQQNLVYLIELCMQLEI